MFHNQFATAFERLNLKDPATFTPMAIAEFRPIAYAF